MHSKYIPLAAPTTVIGAAGETALQACMLQQSKSRLKEIKEAEMTPV
jgi:hypothetical protein